MEAAIGIQALDDGAGRGKLGWGEIRLWITIGKNSKEEQT